MKKLKWHIIQLLYQLLHIIKPDNIRCVINRPIYLIKQGKVSEHWDSWFSETSDKEWINSPDRIIEGDGVLRMLASHKEKRGEGARLYTGRTKFGFGYYELLAKVPDNGIWWWFAFWLWGNANDEWPPEIDIAEFMANDSLHYTVSNHYKVGDRHIINNLKGSFPDLSKGFYSYGLDWQPDSLTFYLGGYPIYKTKKNTPQLPMGVTLTIRGDNAPMGEEAEVQIKNLVFYPKKITL